MKQIIMLAPILGLTACTTGSESFSTEKGTGSGWKSMTKTHEFIQKSDHDKKNFDKSCDPITDSATSNAASNVFGQQLSKDQLTTYTSLDGVARVPEQYLRVWFAPYQDANGNFHEGCVVQTVVRSAQWIKLT